MTYRLTRRARRDVSKIWAYIATDSESAADRLLSLLMNHFQMLGTSRKPENGATTYGPAIAASPWVSI